MGLYQVEIKPTANKALDALPKPIRNQLTTKIYSLKENPRPQEAIKLKSPHELYRIRSGDYRVVYAIIDAKLIVVIVKAGHRRDIYGD